MIKMISHLNLVLITSFVMAHVVLGQSGNQKGDVFHYVQPAQPATRSDSRNIELRGTFGYSAFADDSLLHHSVAGGSMRIYITRRFSVEPELLYMYRSKADQDVIFTPHVAFDFAGSNGRIKPYVIGGVGVLRHRSITGRGSFSSNSWSAGGGIGVKIFITKRIFISPEARLGWEPFLRVTGSIGCRLN